MRIAQQSNQNKPSQSHLICHSCLEAGQVLSCWCSLLKLLLVLLLLLLVFIVIVSGIMASENSALIEQGTEYIGDSEETVVAVAEKGNGTGKGKMVVTGKKQEEKMKKLTLLIEKKINTEDLIYEVEKNPCVWDSRVEGYSNKIDKLNAWNDILVYFINDFESKPIDEKNILVTIVQKKWKGIRTCYARELLKKKNVQSGSGASNRKQYAYFDQLRFLETITKKTTNSMDVEEGEDVNVVEEDVDRDDPLSPGNTASFDNTIRPKTARKRGSRNSDDELIATLKKKAAQDEKEEKNNKDEDRLFLLSLVSELKKVPAHNKLQLRSNIISAIAQAQQQFIQQQWPPLHSIYHTQPSHFPNSSSNFIHPQTYSNIPSSSTVSSFSGQDRHNNNEALTPLTSPSPASSDNTCFSQMSEYVTYNNN